MLAITVLVFCAAFMVAALLLIAAGRPQASRQANVNLALALNLARYTGREQLDVSKEHRLSTIPWLNDLLSGMHVLFAVRQTLVQAGLSWTPARLMLLSALFWIACTWTINWRLHVGVLALAPALLAGILPFIYVLRRRRYRLNLMQQKLPESLDLMVSALRAGHSMVGALGTAARESPDPIGRELRVCFEEINFGVDLRTAMRNLLDRIPLQDIRMVATAMLIHKESGGNLAEVLEKTAAVIRDRSRLHQEIRVHTAQGRLSGFVLIVLPIAIAIALSILNPQYIRLLIENPLGQKMLGGALAMSAIGLLIIRKIVNIRI